MDDAYVGASIPSLHRNFLDTALEVLRADSRLVGVAVGGSFVTQTMDAFSDLDLLIAVEPSAYEAVLRDRRGVAERLGPLLAAFTGEHVGEPRLLICLYGPPLLHVDLKFVSLDDVAHRVEDPAIVWEREGRLSEALQEGEAEYPEPDLQWIEDRFWVWTHYGATKIRRGELFEAIGFLAFLRDQVLGPLILMSKGARPSGVRKVEHHAPEWVDSLARTVARYDGRSCIEAMKAAVEVYRELRDALADGVLGDGLERNVAAEKAAMAYLRRTEEAFG